jgi:DNA replication and repair protein RecF
VHVAHLWLHDFRSYAEAELPLQPGVVSLIGPNGQGKTNVVEAVQYAASQDSHRVASDAPLVRLGADRAVVRVDVVREDRHALVELEIRPGGSNRARLNRAPVPRAREVLGVLRSVMFAPEDLALVKGDPAERRRFLDELLVARAPRFAGVRADYERVLRQRSALLKSAGVARRGGGDGALGTLDVWDAHLARTGAELLAARLALVDALRPLVQGSYAAVADPAPGPVPVPAGDRAPDRAPDRAAESAMHLVGGSANGPASDPAGDPAGDGPAAEPAPGVGLSYRPSLDLPEGTSDRGELTELLLAEVSKRRGEELDRGVCLVGPHRDDLALRIGPLPAKGYASHGESWSLALALRLASFDLLRAEEGGSPVLILDDVFAELDVGRRDRLAAMVAVADQVLITAAVADDVPASLDGVRFDVRDSEVHRAS